jgi:BirA family biotin operon repressor/biotin-[acetyl-CoA-carboxylase] ligase
MNQHFPHTSNAISVSQSIGEELHLDTQLSRLLELLEMRYLQLSDNKLSNLKDEYLGSLYWRDESHWFQSKGSRFEGLIEGIDDSGQLVVRTNTGRRSFGVREIVYDN